MQEVVNVNDKQLSIVEWKGQRVITTAQLAYVYGTDTNNVQNNFSRNKERFEEGKHFYLLEGNELRTFKREVTNSDLVKQNVNHLYLWTRRGASRHCKILDTEKAWEQFDSLEENYYNPQYKLPHTPGEQIRLLAQGYTELEEKVDNVAHDVKRLEYDIPLYGAEADELCNHVKRKGTEVLGGKKSNAYKDNKIRHAVYSDIYNQIKREYGLYDERGCFKTYKALKRRHIQGAHDIVDTYEAPTYLSEQIKDCNAQVSIENYENTKEKEQTQ